SLLEEKKIQTHHLSEVGIDIIQHFYDDVRSGKMTKEQAQAEALEVLKSATYGENGYFWVNSTNGKLLMQPYVPGRVGIPLIDWTDMQGTFIFREFIKTAKSGGGWVKYYWPKPHADEESPKISYVMLFKPWAWVLGTGVYIDDVKRNVYRAVMEASGILIATFLIFMLAAIYTTNYFIGQLNNIAIRDGLTHLYTVRFLNEMVPSLLRKFNREKDLLLAAIFIDIDHFKRVNDHYGHACGDKVLAEIAKQMTKMTRGEDICVRFGGEEFVFIGFFESRESILNTAERIREDASQLHFRCKGVDFQITLSAGIAIYCEQDESFDAMLQRADDKMYESKQAGRNRVSI
ncbi:MAG: diguanylate cyclase, partial [Hydrogenovibrio sp.]|nr:diguanylate cyclase [Hydrogenovibrio sp.]